MAIVPFPSLVATISNIDSSRFILPAIGSIFSFQLSVANNQQNNSTDDTKQKTNETPNPSNANGRNYRLDSLILNLPNTGNTTSTTSGNIAVRHRMSIAIDIITDNTTSIPSYLIDSRANETLCQSINETSHTLII